MYDGTVANVVFPGAELGFFILGVFLLGFFVACLIKAAFYSYCAEMAQQHKALAKVSDARRSAYAMGCYALMAGYPGLALVIVTFAPFGYVSLVVGVIPFVLFASLGVLLLNYLRRAKYDAYEAEALESNAKWSQMFGRR